LSVLHPYQRRLSGVVVASPPPTSCLSVAYQEGKKGLSSPSAVKGLRSASIPSSAPLRKGQALDCFHPA
jgi:hypothetical protein